MSNRNSAWLALIAMVAVGCGGGDAGGGDEGMEGGGEMEAAAPAVDPAIAATISGTISFTGTAPAAEAIDMSEEPTCADKYDSQPMTQRYSVSDGHLANVFVFVSEGLGDRKFPVSQDAVEINQEGCRYHPHVLAVQTGQPLLIHNSDDVLHNINTESTKNRPFNISQPSAGMESTRTFNTAEVMIPVKCDVHGWMHAYIGVTDSPFHAVTDADGTFTISGLPPGTYTIEAWHEELGAQTMSLTVGESETGTADFTYDENAAYAPVPMGEPLVVSHGESAAG